MKIKITGMNYGRRPAIEYIRPSTPPSVNTCFHDQAKFNLLYLLFLDEIEEQGSEFIDPQIDWLLSVVVRDETREALLGPASEFMAHVLRNSARLTDIFESFEIDDFISTIQRNLRRLDTENVRRVGNVYFVSKWGGAGTSE